MKNRRFSLKKIALLLGMILCMATVMLPAVQTEAAPATHISHKKITMYAGESGAIVLLTDTHDPTSGKCKWKVSNPDVIKGKAEGAYYFFTGLKKGKATITCTSGGKKFKCRVTVKSIRKKSDLKVLASYKNEDGNKIQLIRVKNRTKSKKSISLYQKEGDVSNPRYAVPGGKYAYFIRNTSYTNYINVYRQNVTVGLSTDTNPGKNITSKVKATIKIDGNNNYTISYHNKYKRYADIDATYVLYDENGKPIYMNYDYMNVAPGSKDSNTYTLPGDKKAVRGKIYINATCY